MSRSAKPRKRKPAPQRSKLPRYVVKLHDDDFFDEEDAEALRLIILTMPLSAAQT
ncbi:IS91, orf2 [Escherichia coli]|nr:IS91, orf2 [Escherichia coli]